MASAKKPKAEKVEKPKPPPKRTEHERYEIVTVHRSQIKNAPYNPRIISDKAKHKLRQIIKKRGLVEPPVWNIRSGNLVGGHQRLSIIDSLEGSQDYLITVAQVDLDDKAEKELNIALNNSETQGEWDLEKLGSLFKDDKLDFEGTGFDTGSIYQLFGDNPILEQPEQLQKLADQIREAHQAIESIKEGTIRRNDIDFYLVVVFRSSEDCTKFLEAMALPTTNKFVDGKWLTAKLGAAGEGPEITT